MKQTLILLRKAKTGFNVFIELLIWFLLERKKFYRYLINQYAIKKIKPFKPLSWKHKTRYFVGIYEERKVFIKTGGRFHLTKREVETINRVMKSNPELVDHLPNIITYELSPPFCFVVEDFIDGISLLEFKKTLVTIDERTLLINQIYDLYLGLIKAEVNHMDIRPENFLIRRTDAEICVVLIDFAFSIAEPVILYPEITNNRYNINIIKHLGSNYKPEVGYWDDAYSFLEVMRFIDPDLKINYPNIWLRLNFDTGKRLIKLNDLI